MEFLQIVGLRGGIAFGRGTALKLAVVVDAVFEEFAGGAVQRDLDVFAGLVAGEVDRLQDGFEGLLSAALEVRGEAAFVADGGGESLVLQNLFQRVEGFGPHAERFAEALRADRADHELLKGDRRVGVGAAVDDVHHRHRHHLAVHAAEVAEERQLKFGGGGLGDRQ